MEPFIIESLQERLTIIIEPMANEYYLKKGDVLKITQEEKLKGYYRMVACDGENIQIYPEGDYSC